MDRTRPRYPAKLPLRISQAKRSGNVQSRGGAIVQGNLRARGNIYLGGGYEIPPPEQWQLVPSTITGCERGLLDSISTYDHEATHRRLAGSRMEGTAQWIFTTPEYMAWLREECSTILCCSGIIGSGKTILASAIIDFHVSSSEESGRNVLYFYQDPTGKSSTEESTMYRIVSSLLRQALILAAQSEKRIPLTVREQLSLLYRRPDLRPGYEEIIEGVLDLLRLLDKPIVVLDGFNDLPEVIAGQLISFCTSLMAAADGDTKLAIFCREGLDQQLRKSLALDDLYFIAISRSLLLPDLMCFVKTRVSEKVRASQLMLSNAVLKEVEATLIEQTENM